MQPLPEPRVFSNRYELTHLVARGGMAEVYRAVDRRLGRPVALKVLFPELSVDRTFVERFRREAQAAANLSHPNIVPVFDWGEDNGTYFIVMEYVDGDPLSAVLRTQGPLPPDRAVAVAAPVAAALGYAHRHGVVHRDVKPGNVLLTGDGQVKVTDFGIARAVNTEESLTQTGAVMGTATYFSPEQAEGRGVDARSDIYSLGVVLYEMLTGRPPFIGDSPVAVASKHVRDEPPLPRELVPSIPVALENVVMQALAKSPDHRYQSAEDFRADLVRFAEGAPVTAVDAAVTGVMTPPAGVGTTQMLGAAGATSVMAPESRFEPRSDTGHRQGRLVLFIVVLLIILGLIIYFIGDAVGWWGSSTASVTVPDVSGQTVAVATSNLEHQGLRVIGERTIASTAVNKGLVVRTVPASSSSVTKGSGITLYVSGGAKVVYAKVPSVVNLSVSSAEAALSAKGFAYTTTYAYSDTAASGVVTGQNPGGGTSQPRGSTITLTVSSGPTPTTTTTTTVPPTTTTTAPPTTTTTSPPPTTTPTTTAPTTTTPTTTTSPTTTSPTTTSHTFFGPGEDPLAP